MKMVTNNGNTKAWINHTNNDCATSTMGNNSGNLTPNAFMVIKLTHQTTTRASIHPEKMFPNILAESDIILAKIPMISSSPIKSDNAISPILDPMDCLPGSPMIHFPVIGTYSNRVFLAPCALVCFMIM